MLKECKLYQSINMYISFTLKDNTLRHHNTNLCMELSEDGQKVEMKPCNGIDRQIWLWKRKTPDDEKRRKGIPIGQDAR